MPHSSYPLDDIRALSFYREHGFPLGESRGRLGGVGSVRKHLQFSLLSEMSVCLMDTFFLYNMLCSHELNIFCLNVFLSLFFVHAKIPFCGCGTICHFPLG